VAAVDAALPALPAERRTRLAAAAGVTLPDEAVTIVVDRGLDELALGAIEAGADAARTLTHVQHDLAHEGAAGIAPADLAELVRMETAGELTSSQAKQVLAEMAATHRSPGDIAAAHGFEAVDTSELEALVDRLVAAHPDEWARFVGGEGKMQGFFVGQVMRETGGQADGRTVNQLLQQRKG
jgi:aspartyl-tRNA(Asn)/glutamyl-tRNA(Gln) amidotransferase subunit B